MPERVMRGDIDIDIDIGIGISIGIGIGVGTGGRWPVYARGTQVVPRHAVDASYVVRRTAFAGTRLRTTPGRRSLPAIDARCRAIVVRPVNRSAAGSFSCQPGCPVRRIAMPRHLRAHESRPCIKGTCGHAPVGCAWRGPPAGGRVGLSLRPASLQAGEVAG